MAGVRTVSSRALAEQFHLNAAQIRKDLAYFGEFGVRGVGYYVKELRRHLREILGIDRAVRVAIMGAGNLGLALADYPGIPRRGVRDCGALRHDARQDRAIVAQAASPSTTSASSAPWSGESTSPSPSSPCRPRRAQPVVNAVVAAGVKAVLNFSPGALQVPPDVKLKSVDLTVSLESLSFFLAQGEAHE